MKKKYLWAILALIIGILFPFICKGVQLYAQWVAKITNWHEDQCIGFIGVGATLAIFIAVAIVRDSL